MTIPATAAREAVLAIHRRMAAALDAVRDSALEELMPSAAAPPPPPLEGPGLAQAAAPMLDRLSEIELTASAPVVPDALMVPMPVGQLRALRRALSAEDERARKDRALRERWIGQLVLARAELVFVSQEEAVRRARGRIHTVACELIDGTSELGSTP